MNAKEREKTVTAAFPWDIDHLTILHGNHEPPNGAVKACAMEAAYLRWAAKQGWNKKKIVAGWTDSLDCVCPTIGAFVRRWNDSISSDETRTRIFSPALLDLLPNTKVDDALMLRRMWLAIDWDIRVRTPAFLRLAKLDAEADALERLAPIDSQARLTDAREIAQRAARSAAAAGDAARAAAGDAARAAAGDAARAAARAAAMTAALAVTLTVEELRALVREEVRAAVSVPAPAEAPEILSREEVAKLLGVHIRVVTRYVKDRGLPGGKLGGNEWRFRRSDVEAWMQREMERG